MHPYVRLVRARRAAALLVAAPLLIAGCSDSGSKSTTQGSSSGSSASASAGAGGASGGGGGTCTPKAGKDLVVMADDKQSQASDNIVAIATTSVAKPPLTTALDKVSAALSQEALVGLNRAVSSSGGETPTAAAKKFVADNKLADGLSGGSGSITIGTQAFAESNVLGAVYQQVLNAAGYKATARQVGSRDLLEPAVEKGEIQVVPEYAASLTQFLAQKFKTSDKASADITKTMATLKPLAARAKFTALTPAAATDQNAFAVTKATSDAYQLKTFSDVASKCGSSLTFGAGANCPANPFCQDAIKAAYGVTVQLKPLDYDGPLTRKALQQGRILVGEVFSSDADLVKAS